jgi:hypothetical protein
MTFRKQCQNRQALRLEPVRYRPQHLGAGGEDGSFKFGFRAFAFFAPDIG